MASASLQSRPDIWAECDKAPDLRKIGSQLGLVGYDGIDLCRLHHHLHMFCWQIGTAKDDPPRNFVELDQRQCGGQLIGDPKHHRASEEVAHPAPRLEPPTKLNLKGSNQFLICPLEPVEKLFYRLNDYAGPYRATRAFFDMTTIEMLLAQLQSGK
jgi:hypothetical protein